MRSLHTMELSTVVVSSAEEANAAHRRIVGMADEVRRGAAELGRFLTQEKNDAGHGNWEKWVKDNLCFNTVTAWRYMQVYSKSLADKDLAPEDTYKLLCHPAPKEPNPEPKSEPKKANPPKKEPASAYKPEEREAEVVGESGQKTREPDGKSWSAFEDLQYCEISLHGILEERDLFRAAVRPENNDWKKAAVAFFKSVRDRGIATV